jgi:hypothetical protein
MHGDWVTATATVLAAVIGIFGGYLLAKYQREKRRLRFVVLAAQDLASSLRAHGDFEIKFADFSTRQLALPLCWFAIAGIARFEIFRLI